MSGEAKTGLAPVQEKFILHWGEMGTKWGINRTVAQVHALLYLAAKPLPADEISTTLSVARSNVSTSLRELQGWGIVRVVHVLGDRRDPCRVCAGSEERSRRCADERASGGDAGIFGGDVGTVRRDFADADRRIEERREAARESDHVVGYWKQEGGMKRRRNLPQRHREQQQGAKGTRSEKDNADAQSARRKKRS